VGSEEFLDSWTDLRFPPDLLVTQYDGMDGLVSLDISRKDDQGESPVVVWDPVRKIRGMRFHRRSGCPRGSTEVLSPRVTKCGLTRKNVGWHSETACH